MNITYIIPLSLFFLAIFVSFNTDVKTLDGIPRILAPCIAIVGLIWFFNMVPWLFQVGCVLLLLAFKKTYLPNN
ncbi:MAG: hypothetical protein F6K40_02815 [Okeania sp. SIO3I5]|uniref:hypothetical protein n=1 Tax=Okeania sp. SIO3I5 TaxID=2607805 RepID=UPI0013BC8F2C|nr:hypothetical protein [Okeania sp. SIO3I5]NEQ35293.1 hypothetical protein [Okeania sp. SIO3I5]